MTNFHADGPTVFQSPIKIKNEDDSWNIRMGFPICTVSEFIEGREELAKYIAKAMTNYRNPYA